MANIFCCLARMTNIWLLSGQDDRYFLSGSLDGKLRLWNIPDKKVALWNEVSGSTKLITAANFCMNGKFAVVGTYDGRCVFYSTDVRTSTFACVVESSWRCVRSIML